MAINLVGLLVAEVLQGNSKLEAATWPASEFTTRLLSDVDAAG